MLLPLSDNTANVLSFLEVLAGSSPLGAAEEALPRRITRTNECRVALTKPPRARSSEQN
jgi:hypothetical protein